MASAWGKSWGLAFGAAFGLVQDETPLPMPSIETGFNAAISGAKHPID